MEGTAATDTANSDLPPSSTPWPGEGVMTVVVAVVVGLVGGVVVWWRCGGWRRCSRQLLMRRVVRAKRSALYRFLSDPAHLKVIHPYTTEVRMKTEAEEEGGGVTLKEFDWVEKVPFTVVSAARMRCDPRAFTITIDVVPAGSIHQVHLKWWLIPNNLGCSDLNDDQTGQPKSHHESEALPTTTIIETATPTASATDDKEKTTLSDSADDKGKTTLNDSADDKGKTTLSDSADDKTVTSAADVTGGEKTGTSLMDEEPLSTEFRYQIRVTGPGPCVLVVTKIVERIAVKLMDRLQRHFQDRSE